jgi:hypothetical protein
MRRRAALAAEPLVDRVARWRAEEFADRVRQRGIASPDLAPLTHRAAHRGARR